jgi:hypothetical protein
MPTPVVPAMSYTTPRDMTAPTVARLTDLLPPLRLRFERSQVQVPVLLRERRCPLIAKSVQGGGLFSEISKITENFRRLPE